MYRVYIRMINREHFHFFDRDKMSNRQTTFKREFRLETNRK